MASCVSCTLAWPVRGRAGPGLAAEAQSFSPCGTTCSGPAKPRRDMSFQLRVTWPWGRTPSASGPVWLRRETEGMLHGAPGSDTCFTSSGSLGGERSSLCKPPEHRLGKGLSSGFKLFKIEKLPGP